MFAAPSPKPYRQLVSGVVLFVAAIAIIGAIAGTHATASGGVSPGATQISLSLGGPAGAALVPGQAFERDPSVPQAAEVFTRAAVEADADTPSF
ncbi:MAG TPA: hypothetical protein VNU71_03665 [Burkholderiaceae bacterium]|nr:hypothetical protein [Burkholderiaceae bacterium]